jgi:hypothetical protein
MARFVAIIVFPSPGPVLVTTRVLTPSSVDENRMFVLIERIASAKPGGTPLLMSGSPPCQVFGSSAGTIPSDGSPRY